MNKRTTNNGGMRSSNFCSSSRSILELKNVTYTYDGETTPIWKSFSCTFQKGEIHAICGPSGCGKSSLLYLIDGLIPHMYEGQLEGAVLLNNKDITNIPPRQRCGAIGLVMQDPEQQFCTFTVEEELAFGMENMGISPTIMKERIRDILHLVGMSDAASRELHRLSGGEKQKIAIASVLVTEPDVLLLDEPTANLDPDSREHILDLIVTLAAKKELTVIMVEHNLTEIAEHVDHILTLDSCGNLLYDNRSDVLPLSHSCLPHDDRSDVLPDSHGCLLYDNRTDVLPHSHSCLPHDNRSDVLPDSHGCLLHGIPGRVVMDETPLIEVDNLCFSYNSSVTGRHSRGKSLFHNNFFTRWKLTRQKLTRWKRRQKITEEVLPDQESLILKNVCMKIYPGELLAITGENGAGKSTLLKLLFKLEKPNAGMIRIDGRNLEIYPTKKLYQRMGLVFQNPEHQFVTNCVRDELMFSLKRTGLQLKQKTELVENALKQYDLTSVQDHSPFALSQGQKRRLSVACMLLTGQDILFLDEPTYGQDPENRHELMRHMQQLAKTGVTVVMITHDMELVRQYATRVIHLEKTRRPICSPI